MIVKGKYSDLRAKAKSLVAQPKDGENFKFNPKELSDGFAYAEGPKEWFEGVEVTNVKKIPSHCSNCKTITDGRSLTDGWCNTCIEND